MSHLTGPPKERGSVRPVTIENEPDKTMMCEVRTMSGSGLRPGDIVWVEFGATWATKGGRQIKIDGQWRQAIVLPSSVATASGVHIRLSPKPSTEPFG